MLKLPIRYTRRCFLTLLSLADSSFWLLGCYRVKEKNVLIFGAVLRLRFIQAGLSIFTLACLLVALP